jgi:uncharacterized protein (TIGR00725 family)
VSVDTNSSPANGGPSAVEVAVLGSARIGPGDPRHHQAQLLGGQLAAHGWTVVTGGYGGLMAAVAGGAQASGGRTVGLPMRTWPHLTPDTSCAELRWSDSYAERLAHLLSTRVAIALTGGVGTLAEAAAVWAAAQTEPRATQLVLAGPAWRALMTAFAEHLVVGEPDLALPVVVDEISAAVPAVQRLLARPASAPGARG